MTAQATMPAEKVARLLRAALADELPGRRLTALYWIALTDFGYPDHETMRGNLPMLDRMGSRRIAFVVPTVRKARP